MFSAEQQPKPTKQGPIVRQRTETVKGKTYVYWRVDLGIVDGKRKIRTFSSEADALKFSKNWASEQKQFGKAAFSFTEDQRRDAAEAFTILGGKQYPNPPKFPSGTLRAAAWYYMQHNALNAERITVTDAFGRFMAENERNGLRKASLLSYANMTGRYVRSHGEKIVADVTRREFDEWIRTLEVTPGSLNSYRRHCHAFFEFCRAEGYTHHDNPATARKQARHDKRHIDYLTATRAAALLKAAAAGRPGRDLIPYLAIGMFAGLRPSELNGQFTDHGPMPLSCVDLVNARIVLPAAWDKNRQGRNVDIRPNLAAWLTAFPIASDTVFYSRKHLASVFKSAGVALTPDVLRHTFGTMHWAAFRHEGDTAIQMGNTISTVRKHYVNKLATKADAEAFWGIMPPTPPR